MVANTAGILFGEDPLTLSAPRMAGKFGRAIYSGVSGRDFDSDASALRGGVQTLREPAGTSRIIYNLATGRELEQDVEVTGEGLSYLKTLAEPLGITRLGYRLLRGKELEQDIQDGIGYAKGLPSRIGRYFLDLLLGHSENREISDSQLGEIVKSVLSDEIDFETRTQEQLHKISGGKFGTKRIYGLCDTDQGKIYLSEEAAEDEGLKYRTLLHEALEAVSDRPDNHNDEKGHLDIELSVIRGFEYAAKSFRGELKEKAKKAKDAFYKTVYEGREAGDDLMTEVVNGLSDINLN